MSIALCRLTYCLCASRLSGTHRGDSIFVDLNHVASRVWAARVREGAADGVVTIAFFVAYSVKAPNPGRFRDPTLAPGWNFVTCLPTASTCPATSAPRTLSLGLRSPACRREMYGLPLTGE